MSPGDGEYRLVLSTAGSDEQAREIARELVERRLAACVSIVGGVCSVFRWEGAVNVEDEKLLLIKTRRDRFEQLRAAIRELHSYDVPEVLSLSVDEGDADYLAWLGSCLDG